MADRLRTLTGPELERALREVGRHVAYPDGPVAGAVAARLRPRRRARRLAPAVALLLVLLAGTAVAAGLGVPGIELGAPERTLPPEPLALDQAFLGTPVTLAEARARVAFDVKAPTGLPAPAVHLRDGRVSLVYPELLLTQFAGDVDDDPLLVKQPGRSGPQPVTVAGGEGWWIEGEHSVTTGDGARRAGNALIWHRDGVTYRLESDLPLERALAIAGSLR
jgi:hypothetical protein